MIGELHPAENVQVVETSDKTIDQLAPVYSSLQALTAAELPQPMYSSISPSYSSISPTYSPISPSYSPISKSFSPTSSLYSLLSPSYHSSSLPQVPALSPAMALGHPVKHSERPKTSYSASFSQPQLQPQVPGPPSPPGSLPLDHLVEHYERLKDSKAFLSTSYSLSWATPPPALLLDELVEKSERLQQHSKVVLSESFSQPQSQVPAPPPPPPALLLDELVGKSERLLQHSKGVFSESCSQPQSQSQVARSVKTDSDASFDLALDQALDVVLETPQSSRGTFSSCEPSPAQAYRVLASQMRAKEMSVLPAELGHTQSTKDKTVVMLERHASPLSFGHQYFNVKASKMSAMASDAGTVYAVSQENAPSSRMQAYPLQASVGIRCIRAIKDTLKLQDLAKLLENQTEVSTVLEKLLLQPCIFIFQCSALLLETSIRNHTLY